MLFQQIYPLIAVFLFNTVCLGSEYSFPVLSEQPAVCKPLHWRHHTTNSAVEIKGIEIDVFQWRAAAKSRESVQVEILNPNWEFAGWVDDDFVLHKITEISDAFNFRGTLTVHIRVTPWRIMNGRIEVLTQGEIQISVDPVDFPITYSHPYLLNGGKRSFKRGLTENTEYLIICPSQFQSAAQSLADMHSNEDTLITEVVSTENISEDIDGMKIREYLISRINENTDLNFLLLFGDEIDIPPLFKKYLDIDGNTQRYPSDDYYSTPNILLNANDDDIDTGDPQLATGRIPISTEEDAWAVVEKIKEYTLNPTPGIWRSKIALVADDMYSSCSFDNRESSHTENSDAIYDSLKTLLPVQLFYGVHYGIQPKGAQCIYPDLTGDLIRTINNGVALVNYIGHGDPETWAGEKLISKSRDLSLIKVDGSKLAIWVAGTCSFGKYNGENSFMEDLLLKEDGAIAVVATTDVVGYTENSNYLFNLFGLNDTIPILGIQDMIKDNFDIRLGELVLNAKNGNYHKFHTFGDPALRLPFPKFSNDIISESERPESITLIEEQSLSVENSDKHSSLLIRGTEKEIAFGDDNLLYSIPGVTYAQVNFTGSDGCFRIPLDASSCDSCSTDIYLYQDNNGSNGIIQFIPDIPFTGSDVNSNDIEGPEIQIFQSDHPIVEGSVLLPTTDLKISLNDSSGINLMETIGHGIRYAFDEDELTIIPGVEFIYNTCSGGAVQIPVIDIPGKHHFYLEAWDGVNNQSTLNINFEILGSPQKGQLLISKVYPFPNPFSESTHFTMFISDTPTNITITVYSLMGSKVRTLEDKAEESFFSIPWDGKDQSGNRIANGAYFYHVKAEKDGKNVFEDIFKLAKIE